MSVTKIESAAVSAARMGLLGGTVIAALTLAAGCAAEPAGEGSTDVNVSVDDSVSPRAMRTTTCEGATPAKQLIATNLVRYAFGNDAFAPPTSTTACTKVKNALLRLRTGINDGTLLVGRGYADRYCAASDSIHYDIDDFESVDANYIKSIIADLKANTDVCYGQGTLAFLMPYDEDWWDRKWGGGAYFIMDPEAATLTANLGSSTGATAAAYYTNTPEVATKALKWGSSYTSCGTVAAAGLPCSTTALSAGQQAMGMIQKFGSLCACR